MSDLKGDKDALVKAIEEWAADSEGSPSDPSDARLLKALWSYQGDNTQPCPECDGECGEPCAPCTVAEAHAGLDRFIAEWNKRHGITPVLALQELADLGQEISPEAYSITPKAKE